MKLKLRTLATIGVASLLAAGTIDLNNLDDYESLNAPNYIVQDNTPNNNAITDAGATLGRVLFYDKRLSANNTIACASCHQQEFAFSDPDALSEGLDGGLTGRHAMRLVNSRYSEEVNFFWDERATSLEDQTTKPIQDAVEMGYSGTNGDEDINDLITKLSNYVEYRTLFAFVFGDSTITESRMQLAMGQFIRSIHSFDSEFDQGLAQVNNINQNFPNYSTEENDGKTLFLQAPDQGGAGCQGCHRGPEFDIDPNSGNNGVIGVAGDPNATDLTNTRAPSLRDLVNPQGTLNGPLMHNGEFTTIRSVIEHYNDLVHDQQANPDLDARLSGGPGGTGQQLNLTEAQMDALEAFLLTLTGSDIYTNPIYSDPFEPDGSIDVEPLILGLEPAAAAVQISVFPNPTTSALQFEGLDATQHMIRIYDLGGRMVLSTTLIQGQSMDVQTMPAGVYHATIEGVDNGIAQSFRFVKQ